MPWSVADFSAFRLSVGESLLSMPVTSNFTPAGLLALTFSMANFQLLSWLLPTGAIRPDSGSIQASLTVSPFWAETPDAAAAMRPAATSLSANFIGKNLLVDGVRKARRAYKFCRANP